MSKVFSFSMLGLILLLAPAAFAQSLNIQTTSEPVVIDSDFSYVDADGLTVDVQGPWLSPEIAVVNNTPEDITLYSLTVSISDGLGNTGLESVSLPDIMIRPGDQIILDHYYFSFPSYKVDEIVAGQIEVDGSSANFTYYSSAYFTPIH